MARTFSSGSESRAIISTEVVSATELVQGLRRRELHPTEALEQYLRRIDEHRSLNAFLWVDPERVLAAADRVVKGSPLAGLPIALKDNIDTAGIPTTSGSQVDVDRLPNIDAVAWARLRDVGGAMLIGKAHLCEFAYRVHHPAFGWVHNPRWPARATGGSSSGSAAAVAAGLAPAAVGSDTGGSVRIPAAYCGVVGLKGTYGLIENHGLVPLSPSMDHIGVLAGNVSDAALIFEQVVPKRLELLDRSTLKMPPCNPDRLRVGVELDYFGSNAEPSVLANWNRACHSLASVGCPVSEVQLPNAARWRSAHKTVLLREAWDYHARRLRSGAPYGPVFRAAVGAGGQISDQKYRAALALRNEAREQLSDLFQRVDILLTPTCPTVAPWTEEGRHGVRYTRFTTLAAFTGVPAISIPSGKGQGGLPVGVQMMAGWNREKRLLGAAALLEGLLSTSSATI